MFESFFQKREKDSRQNISEFETITKKKKPNETKKGEAFIAKRVNQDLKGRF